MLYIAFSKYTLGFEMFAQGGLFMSKMPIFQRVGIRKGVKPLPLTFQCDSYDMKTLWFEFGDDIFSGFKMPTLYKKGIMQLFSRDAIVFTNPQNMKKQPSKVAHNWPRSFYFTVQTRPQPRIDFHIMKSLDQTSVVLSVISIRGYFYQLGFQNFKIICS